MSKHNKQKYLSDNARVILYYINLYINFKSVLKNYKIINETRPFLMMNAMTEKLELRNSISENYDSLGQGLAYLKEK